MSKTKKKNALKKKKSNWRTKKYGKNVKVTFHIKKEKTNKPQVEHIFREERTHYVWRPNSWRLSLGIMLLVPLIILYFFWIIIDSIEISIIFMILAFLISILLQLGFKGKIIELGENGKEI